MSLFEETKNLSINRGEVMTSIVNTLFDDANSIKMFSVDEMFYYDDLVLVPKKISGKDKDYIYRCIKNGFSGEFNNQYFKKFTLKDNNIDTIDNYRVTATVDGQTNIVLKHPISKGHEQIKVVHSVKGILIEDKDYKIENEEIIVLEDPCFQGEYFDISVIR